MSVGYKLSRFSNSLIEAEARLRDNKGWLQGKHEPDFAESKWPVFI